MDDEATQPFTQQVVDPRRLGRNNSGLSTADLADVLCILHPATPAAFQIIAGTLVRTPQHVLQNDVLEAVEEEIDFENVEEQETFIINSKTSENARDLALRMSSKTVNPVLGFCFGRNPRTCDILIDMDSTKRISNLHFRIFVNTAGVLMLEDLSTNGTMVDDKHLKGKNAAIPATRMLNASSIIQIPSTRAEEAIKFIVRIPSRADSRVEYGQNLQHYIMRVAELERLHAEHARQIPRLPNYGNAMLPTTNQYGMHWDGGEDYNVVGTLGKGAFATVYKIATKIDGQVFAAKELDKRRFTKNGRLDQKLDNEMQIMKSIRHQAVVEYHGYRDHAQHLYIIMEFVPCGDLQGYLGINGVLPETDAKLMSQQVLDALLYLHNKKITHRDIKPDNILIADFEPFTIKLSDFGLSKVVNSTETFMKTFCGTLLYCAPEVFPHYVDHVASQGTKRRRPGNATTGRFHSYSHSVDVWSYAAVLWLSLCGRPPFEGVVDQTGRGMFNKIMSTSLDVNPLLARGISADAISLLIQMLNKDPAHRPTEVECLRHPWLYDGRHLPTSSHPATSAAGAALGPITEEEEGAASVDGQAIKLSQLSVRDRQSPPPLPLPLPATAGAIGRLPPPNRPERVVGAENEDEYDDWDDDDNEDWEFDSADFGFLDPRQSKRIKADPRYPRTSMRGQAAAAASSSGILPAVGATANHHYTVARPQDSDSDLQFPMSGFATQGRLFGEISDSALKSSAVLGQRTQAALNIDNNHSSDIPDTDQNSMIVDDDDDDDDNNDEMESFQARQTSDLYRSDASRSLGNPSLLSTAAMVKDMHMVGTLNLKLGDSSEGIDSMNEPQTPTTPEAPLGNSRNEKSSLSQKHTSQERTPRQMAAVNTQRSPFKDMLQAQHLGQLDATTAAVPSSAPEMNRRTGLLGTLQTTDDSFTKITLNLTERASSWGRAPMNTFVYSDKADTRIPKHAFTIWFHVYGIEKLERDGNDWTLIPDLRTVISTRSRNGIWVNGISLKEKDIDGVHVCGAIHKGDVITIFKADKNNGQVLSFVCDFAVGAGDTERSADKPFTIERAIEPSQARSSF